MRARRQRKRPLPDLRPRGYTFPEGPGGQQPPEHHALLELATRHRFQNPEAVAATLADDVWFWWRALVQIGPTTPAAQSRELLRAIQDRAAALAEAIASCGQRETTLLHEWTTRQLDLPKLQEHLHDLQLTARIAAGHVPSSKRGRPNGPAGWVARKLTTLWLEEFGERARRLSRRSKLNRANPGSRRAKDNVRAMYSGPLFDFVSDTFALFGIEKSDEAIGKAIEGARRYRKRHAPAIARIDGLTDPNSGDR
jgi:hypothetical protein